MSAKQRLDALDAELAGIETEIDTLTAEHAEHVGAGEDAEADALHRQIVDARQRAEAAQARREPLEHLVHEDENRERAKVAEALTQEADAQLDALVALLAEAGEAAEALEAIVDRLDANAALHWSIAARKAAEAGGSPQRRTLAIREVLETVSGVNRRLSHVVTDYNQRSVAVPVRLRAA